MDTKLKIQSILSIILLIGVTAISSGYSAEEFDLLQCPYSIARKSETELKGIEQRFKDKNGQTWSVELNPYTGLIFSAGNLNFQEVTSPLSKEESQRMIFNFLKENKEFFGLEDFQIGIDPIYEGVSGPNYEDYAYVIEPHQTYRNLFIPRLNLNREYPYVSPDDYKNRISLRFIQEGNVYTQKPHLDFQVDYFYYYPEIRAPVEPKISPEQAIQCLYGYEYESAGFIKGAEWVEGMQAVKCKFQKDKNTFRASRLVILPWPNQQKTKLEFRLAWQIDIDCTNLNETGMYTAYVDAISQEVITLRQNFVI